MATSKPIALITGASSGIGADLARVMAADGYDLVLAARRRDAMVALAADLKARHGTESRVVAIDLGKWNAAADLVTSLEEAGAVVDVLVNNAGIGAIGPFTAMSQDTILDMMNLNMIALTQLTRALLPGMIERRRGGVMNIASTAAFQPGPLMAVYYATKAYVLSLSEALSCEVEGTGVTVTCVCPGPTVSEFQQRAGMEGTPLVSGAMRRVMLTSEQVARMGYDALKAGKSLCITGIPNRLGAVSVRFLPRSLVPRIVKRAHAGGMH